MARLSVSDLNNLSGINDSNLEIIFRYFKEAHCKLMNDSIRWINVYNKNKSLMKYQSYKTMKIFRKLFYEGNLLLDNIRLFMDLTKDYISNLDILRLDKKPVVAYSELLYSKMKEIIKYVDICYNVWTEISNEIYKEEE